jgi:hypothetical protein
MVINTIIISVILVAIIMLALLVKLFFDKDAEFTIHSCAIDDGDSLGKDGACSKCKLKDLSNCPEKTKKPG